jgi:hypothetical protein
VLGLPIFDTTLVTISRLRRRVSVVQGGADHTSHRLVRLGLSHRRAVVALYTVGASLGVVTVLITQSEPLAANLIFGGLVLAGLLVLWLLEIIYRQPAASRFRPDLRVTFIGGGEAMLPLLEGAAAISRTLRVLIMPSNPTEGGMPVARLQALLPVLAESPEAARAVLNGSAGFTPGGSVADQTQLAEAALLLRGRLILTLDSDGNVRDEALSALQHTDLIVLGGDLRENVLPTLTLAEVSHILRRSKRPRVLAHSDPLLALKEIEQTAGQGLITHIVTAESAEGVKNLWYAAADLKEARQVAEALSQIWLRRMQVRGAPQTISGSMHG